MSQSNKSNKTTKPQVTQIYNPSNQMFVKVDKEGKFTSAKSTPYVNVPLKTASKQNKK